MGRRLNAAKTYDVKIETKDYGAGFFRIILRYGFMEEIDVPAALAKVEMCGPQFKMMDTSFFLARQTLIASPRPGMAIWREKLFAWMLRNAESAMEFFKLPTNRVIELGAAVGRNAGITIQEHIARSEQRRGLLLGPRARQGQGDARDVLRRGVRAA